MTAIRYITNDKGEKTAVIVPLKDYEKMLEELDEYACIKAFDKAKSGKSEFVTADAMFKSIESKRKHS